MKTIYPKVYEQYEYQGYIITIQNWMGTDDLEGIVVPREYSHLFNDLFDVENSHRIFESNGINHWGMVYDEEEDEHYEGDFIYLNWFDPDDVIAFLANIQSPAQILNYFVEDINDKFGYNPKTVVLKQINKKFVAPKSSQKQRGYHQGAWSALVRLRDGKCTECGTIEDLHAHHIKSFKNNPELRYDVNNGVTLCGYCHRKWHKENGK